MSDAINLKLSDAILKGAKRRPQQFNNGFFYESGNVLKSCALGAAWEAITDKTEFFDGEKIEDAFPNIWEIIRHPVTNQTLPVFDVVADLNDRYQWTREKIAQYLADIGY